MFNYSIDLFCLIKCFRTKVRTTGKPSGSSPLWTDPLRCRSPTPSFLTFSGCLLTLQHTLYEYLGGRKSGGSRIICSEFSRINARLVHPLSSPSADPCILPFSFSFDLIKKHKLRRNRERALLVSLLLLEYVFRYVFF